MDNKHKKKINVIELFTIILIVGIIVLIDSLTVDKIIDEVKEDVFISVYIITLGRN